MQILISLLFGVICAFAIMRPCPETKRCGWWIILAGVLSANFPHIDNLFYFMGDDTVQAYQNGVTWSYLLAPFYAGFIAWVISLIAKKPFLHIAAASFVALYGQLFLALFTSRDIQMFAPFSTMRFGFDLLYPWDFTMFILCGVIVAVALVLQKWMHLIARAGLVLLAAYIIVIFSFRLKADNFAEQYIDAFELDVEQVHLLPQPISPLHWRIIIETKDQRFHDTLVHIFRKEEKTYKDGDNRTIRLKTLYKPLDKAVWRVYRRFGHIDPVFAKSAWVSMYKASDQFKWLSKYWVAKDVVRVGKNRCARFLDLRREGSRRSLQSLALICKEDIGAVVYKSDKNGKYRVQNMMY